MKLQFESLHCNVSNDLMQQTEKMLNKIEDKHHELFEEAHIYFKEEDDRKEKNKTVKILLELPGHTLLAKSEENTFEQAVHVAAAEIKHQLRQHEIG